jgi:hypothetical protein
MNNSIAPLIVESERVLREAIRHFKLSIDPNEIVVTVQSANRRRAVGWFLANSWQNGTKEPIHEINLSAETLKEDDIGDTLLHELAHAENKKRGIHDCSESQSHNKHFRAMAERLGLVVADRDERLGFGITELGAVGQAFLKKLSFNRQLFAVARLRGTKKVAGRRPWVKLECACGYTVRTTQHWIDVGLPTCPHGHELRPAKAAAKAKEPEERPYLR